MIKLDFIGWVVLFCFGLFLLSGLSVLVKGVWSNYQERRKKIKELEKTI